jgi:hypothetical protein
MAKGKWLLANSHTGEDHWLLDVRRWMWDVGFGMFALPVHPPNALA